MISASCLTLTVPADRLSSALFRRAADARTMARLSIKGKRRRQMEELAKLFDKVVSENRFVVAAFLTAATLGLLHSETVTLQRDKPQTYVLLVLAFTGWLIVINIISWWLRIIGGWMHAWHQSSTAKAKTAAEKLGEAAKIERERAAILALIPALNEGQLVTLRYCKALGLHKFQAWNEDPVLWDFIKMKLLEYGPDLVGAETGIYTFPDFVWEKLPSVELTEDELGTVRKRQAPWDQRRRSLDRRI